MSLFHGAKSLAARDDRQARPTAGRSGEDRRVYHRRSRRAIRKRTMALQRNPSHSLCALRLDAPENSNDARERGVQRSQILDRGR